jgi:hypothetical protein
MQVEFPVGVRRDEGRVQNKVMVARDDDLVRMRL